MKNFVFISPHFPTNYWQFCRELKNNGMNVLGIGDHPYDELRPELKDNLNEYYKVNNMENYDEVYRAVAFFAFKYGRIDWLESNNEYWLRRDAQLRTDFHITSGFQYDYMNHIKHKSAMKDFYIKAGIPVARYHIVDNLEGCRSFAKKVGYPICAKPDNGVGSIGTYKICSDEDLIKFINDYHKDTPYIMEEFIKGQLNTYHAIINSQGEPIFETGHVSLCDPMEVLKNNDNSLGYSLKELPDDLQAAGRAVVKSFNVRSRFVYFEFFRLTEDQFIGKKGELVALEVNMRPCGGFSPDIMNYGNSTNVYKIWADMITFDRTDMTNGERFYCAYMGRRDGKNFVLKHDDLIKKYSTNIKMAERVPDALSGVLANQMYAANFSTKREMNDFYEDACRCL